MYALQTDTMNIMHRVEYILKHNKAAQFAYRKGLSAVFRGIGVFIKTDDNLVLINGLSFKYNDSPKAIFEKMRELGLLEKYHVVWALKEPDKYEINDCMKVKMDTMEYFITALRAKYWISCVNIERALHFKKNNTIYLNTWHGASFGYVGNAVSGRNDFHYEHVNYFCLNGEYERDWIIRDFNVKPEALISTGYPRNDVLYSATEETKRFYREKFGIPNDKKIILYTPTWRESDDGGESYKLAPPIDWKKWERVLGDKYVIFLRTHAYTTKLMNVEFNDFVRDYCEYPDVNHLMIASDVMISDYSCIQLDYSILGRPIICFGYDYEWYKETRGLYFDCEEVMPSGVKRTEDEVLDQILNMDYEEECKKTRKFCSDHMEYGGNAAVQCINKVFGTDF